MYGEFTDSDARICDAPITLREVGDVLANIRDHANHFMSWYQLHRERCMSIATGQMRKGNITGKEEINSPSCT